MPDEEPVQIYSPEQTHLMQMMGLCGEFPQEFLALGKDSSKYYDQSGRSSRCREKDALLIHAPGSLPKPSDSVPLQQLLTARLPPTLQHEVELLASLLGQMLALLPEDRKTAEQLLTHNWLRV